MTRKIPFAPYKGPLGTEVPTINQDPNTVEGECTIRNLSNSDRSSSTKGCDLKELPVNGTEKILSHEHCADEQQSRCPSYESSCVQSPRPVTPIHQQPADPVHDSKQGDYTKNTWALYGNKLREGLKKVWKKLYYRAFFHIVMGILLCFGVYVYPGRAVMCRSVGDYITISPLLSICSSRPVIPKPNPRFEDIVSKSSKFAEFHSTSWQNSRLQKQMGDVRHDFRKLLIELSVGTTDTSTMTSLYSLVPEYNELLDKVIDGMQDCQAKAYGLVDAAIIYTDWTNSELKTIEDRSSSAIAPLYQIAEWVSGSPSHEAEVQKAFTDFAIKLEDQAGVVLSKYQNLRGNLRELEEKLETIARVLLVGHGTFDKRRLSEYSFWKWLIGSQSYGLKMQDIEAKAKLCAEFYQHAQDSLKVIDSTTNSLAETRAGIRNLREEAAKASLPRGKEWSLKLTMQVLEASVAQLHASKHGRAGIRY